MVKLIKLVEAYNRFQDRHKVLANVIAIVLLAAGVDAIIRGNIAVGTSSVILSCIDYSLLLTRRMLIDYSEGGDS